MSKRKYFIWKFIQTVCWLLFAGYCVQTGSLLFNFIYSLFKPIATHNLHLGLDLSQIFTQSKTLYTLVFAFIIAISALKAYLLFMAIRLFKTLNLAKPFSEAVEGNISKITYFTFFIGIVSYLSQELGKKLVSKGYAIGLADRYWNDGGAYIVMSAILFLIVLIFRKGIELQNENDLTV